MSQAGGTATALEARWQRAIRALGARDLDALYMAAGANFQWLVGRTPYPGGLPVWLSALILTADGRGTAARPRRTSLWLPSQAGLDAVLTDERAEGTLVPLSA